MPVHFSFYFRDLQDTFYRFGTFFGSTSVPVNLTTPNPDTQGVFAATEKNKLSLVVVNKNPDTAIAFDLANVPSGQYFIRHFGGEAGVAKWQVSHRFIYLDWAKG